MPKMPQSEREIFADIYKFYETYYNPESDEKWEAYAVEMTRIMNKHKNHPLCVKMILAVSDLSEAHYLASRESREGKHAARQ